MVFRPLKTNEQRRFYDDLSVGTESRGVWGMDKRFSPDSAVGSKSFEKYFSKILRPLLRSDMHVLDVGCGTGMYFPLVAPLCASITGAELSSEYARRARDTARHYGLDNVHLSIQDSSQLAFPDDHFDAALCVDTLHHIYDLDGCLAEIARVVRPGGDILIFEPNCLNPALLAMCVLDRNEWGAVSRCYRGPYRRRFARYFEPLRDEYNGLLIGPQGKLATGIADFLIEGPMPGLLARFSPEIFFHLRNP